VRETIEIGKLRQDLAEASQRIAESDGAKATAEAEFQRLRESYETLNVEHGDLKGRARTIEAEYKRTISELTKSLDSQAANVKDIRDTCATRVTELEEANGRLREELLAAQRRATEESAECSILRKSQGPFSPLPTDNKKAAEMYASKLAEIDVLTTQLVHLTKVNDLLVAKNRELAGESEEEGEEEEGEDDEEVYEKEDEDLSATFSRIERGRSRPPPHEQRGDSSNANASKSFERGAGVTFASAAAGASRQGLQEPVIPTPPGLNTRGRGLEPRECNNGEDIIVEEEGKQTRYKITLSLWP
jgi:chromosome segregation ATPase